MKINFVNYFQKVEEVPVTEAGDAPKAKRGRGRPKSTKKKPVVSLLDMLMQFGFRMKEKSESQSHEINLSI